MGATSGKLFEQLRQLRDCVPVILGAIEELADAPRSELMDSALLAEILGLAAYPTMSAAARGTGRTIAKVQGLLAMLETCSVLREFRYVFSEKPAVLKEVATRCGEGHWAHLDLLLEEILDKGCESGQEKALYAAFLGGNEDLGNVLHAHVLLGRRKAEEAARLRRDLDCEWP